MKRSFFHDLWRLVRPFWVSEEKWKAFALLGVVIGITVGMVYLNVQFNAWYGRFYNALQALDQATFWREMAMFAILAAINVAGVVSGAFVRQLLRIRWRHWLTAHYLSMWLSNRSYYVLQTRGAATTDNPDQRIQEDTDLFVAQTESLFTGLLDSVLTLFAFSVILWNISGTFIIPGTDIAVPGDMFWAALAYAIVGTWLTHLVGRPLIGINYMMYKVNADFRYSMVRVRENAEGIALYGGERDERATLDDRFQAVVTNWWTYMLRALRVNMLTAAYNQTAVVFPFLITQGRFFAGEIPLGTLMQASNSFGEVQRALSFFVNAYSTLADWRANVDRLTTFTRAMDDIRRAEQDQRDITRAPAANSNQLTVSGLDLALPEGTVLQHNLNMTVAPRDSLLIRGPSGVGKSTFFRALAGLWPFGKGRIDLPSHGTPLFLPQKPYLPLGVLRMVVAYPGAAQHYSDEQIREVLTAVGLNHLVDRLDESRNWGQMLSLGEQQRIAFARALLLQPAWIYLDEATSQLDEESEGKLYTLLRKRLPQAGIVSIGHRATLAQYHDRHVTFGAPPSTMAAE